MRLVTASARSFPSAMSGKKDGDALEGQMHRLAQHRRDIVPAAAIGDPDKIHAGDRHEQFAVQMRNVGGAGMRVVDFARIGPGIIDEVLHGLPWR